VRKEIVQLQAAFSRMEASMAAARKSADPDDKIGVYKDQLAQLAQIKSAYNNAAMASGNWHVQTVKNISESEKLTDQIKRQKLGVRDLVKYYKEYQSTSGKSGALSEAIKEQTALRNATASQMTGNVFGKNETDLHVPKNLGSDLDNVRTKLGLINQAIGSASTSMVNWGKNTQWAGRQITVGLTMPLGIAAVGAAALALQVDKSLTDVAKVYDTVSQSQMGQEKELAAVREQGLATATRAAQEYGSSLQDTLDAQAQLAATGLNGAKLQQATNETMRIATLGQMDYQKSVDMTVALQTAFGLSNEDLTKSFDTMNAVENATSLSIQDIADAVPRAASAMAALGGSVNDMIVMLTAMKESGVDAAEAANAIKSATSTILSPSTKAKNYWQETFGVDITEMAKESKGNLLQMMKDLAKVTHGKDAQEVTNGINLLFGKYQFNRAAALFGNLGDAMTGTLNQTATAMQTVGESSEDLAATAATELERWQKSVSGKFKRATESIKAELVPLGMVALQVVTPIIQLVSQMIAGFNNLPGSAKMILLVSAGLLALIGPAMMLVGIFANLAGSVIKFGSTMANLRLRFKAINSEEAAAEILAKKAKSRFDTEGAAAANLTLQLQALTKAMEQTALAQGALSMDSTGKMVSSRADGAVTGTRQVAQRANGSLMYAAGSVDASGNKIGGQTISKADAAEWEKVRGTSVVVSENAKKTRVSMDGVGKALGAITAAGLVFGTMQTGADGTLNTVLNIAMVVGTIGMTFPGAFTKVLGKAKELLTTMKGVGAATAVASTKGKAIGAMATLTTGFKTNGIKGVGQAVSALAPKFASIASIATKIFLPAGILAGGVFMIKKIADAMNEVENRQKAIGSSAKNWADVLGYTYTPGVYDGAAKALDTLAARKPDVDALTEANESLVESLREAAKEGGDFGKVYDMAMQEALKVVTSGGTAAQAKQAFMISLQAAGLQQVEMGPLELQFDSVDLTDPTQIKSQLTKQLNNIIQSIPRGIDAMNGSWFRNAMGGNLSSEARAAGLNAGQTFARMFMSAATPAEQADIFSNFTSQLDSEFSGSFNQIYNNLDDDWKAKFDKLGIDSIGSLRAALGKIDDEGELIDWNMAIGTKGQSAMASYVELMETMLQGMVDEGLITEDKMKEIEDGLWSMDDVKVELDVDDSAVTDAKDDVDEAAAAVNDLDGTNIEITADMRTNQLKSSMSGTMDAIYAEADRRLQASQDAQINSIQAAGDKRQAALEARGKREDAYWDARSDALDKAQQAEDDIFGDAWDNREKGEKASWDRSEDNLSDYWDQREKDTEAYYDNESDRIDATIEAINDETDSRTEAIQVQIDAETDADDMRQKLFDREKTRIERMAELQNDNIDFNSALGSGNLDEAARVYNSTGAKVQQWGLDDQNDALDEIAEKRKKELEDSIDLIEDERDARIDSLNDQKDAISDAKDFRMEALKAEREAAEESFEAQRAAAEDSLARQRELEERALKARQDDAKKLVESQRQAQQDSLANAKTADQARTASAQASAQAQFEADRRGLAQRLQELQAFTPRNQAELNDHIAKVEQAYRDYGINLSAQGNGWAQFIGGALRTNVNTAAISLQNDINWQAMGKVISDRVASSTGMSANDLQFFIQNGRFPKQGITGIFDQVLGAVQRLASSVGSRHTGGLTPGTAGFSAKDRTGVPRSASLFPSETMAILKRGEFVVNEKATRSNYGLLQQINSGAIARHEGGVAEAAPTMVGGMASMQGQVIEMALESWVAQAMAQQAATKIAVQQNSEGLLGGGAFGGVAQGGSQIDRMFNTIKAAFPKARLNDGYRPGASDMHGQGKAVDLGLQGVAGGLGNSYLASMNQWIADNIPNVYELIYDGTGDNRPDLKRGAAYNYGAALQAQHRNHVHWAMQSFHKGGGFGLPQLNAGAFTMSEGLANLHPGEAVLTKPLTDGFKQNVANSTENGYNVTIDLRGALVREDVDIERAVAKAIDARESRNGRRRVVA